jgi:predicted outer membrane repeat protein
MRKSMISRLMAIAGGLMLAAVGTLNSGVGTTRVWAFSVLTVTTTADSGAGSLRDAVNTAAPGDTIMFNLSLPASITLTTGEIDIPHDLTIAGPGADLLAVSTNTSRIFGIGVGTAVSISGLTIHGSAPKDLGGGILNQGTVSIKNCIFSNNTAHSGGAIATGPGLQALTVMGCTFTANSAGLNGGAIFASGGTVSVVNSTFTGNSAGISGGAINSFGATVTVVNSTLSANSVDALFVGSGTSTVVNCTISGNSGGVSGSGINVSPGGTLNLQNTIVAGNTAGDCSATGATIGVNSHNLIQDGSCSPAKSGNLSGNPMLGPLQNNGGPTPTMALLPGSPAIDAGDDSVLGSPLILTTDQRGAGFPRKLGTHVDIGALEFQAPSFDTCLKDNSTGNLFQFSSVTGQYLFTRCSDSFTISGTGVVSLVNGIRTIKDMKSDRKISAGFNTGQLTGNATIYLKVAQGVWQVFQIHDSNPSAVCKC